jgi:hypothetical protein
MVPASDVMVLARAVVLAHVMVLARVMVLPVARRLGRGRTDQGKSEQSRHCGGNHEQLGVPCRAAREQAV